MVTKIKDDPPDETGPVQDPIRRSLGARLLQRTLFLTVILGAVAAAATMWIDLNREKDAIETLTKSFLSSAAPSAAAAAYNYDQAAAEQVAAGLFLKRAIIAVRIINDDDIMVEESRQVAPTLPQFGGLANAEEIILSELLRAPDDGADGDVIGEISITIDRSLVAPEILDRLLTFFIITTAKNVLFGLLLFWTVFNVLARHISKLATITRDWRPEIGAIKAPAPPAIMQGTEVAGLGVRIEELTGTASLVLQNTKRSLETAVHTNDALSKKSAQLSDVVTDRTNELEKANKRLRRLADRDGLTDLHNRASFDRFLSDWFHGKNTASNSLSVMLLDIDYFKDFNDFYGHQAGDNVLIDIAGMLKQIAEETGCFVARYGGEEFVGVVDSQTITPGQISERIHAALKELNIEHQQSSVARRITVSIGTASTADEGKFQTADMLVSAADDALYEAKKNGRDQTVVSTPEIRASMNEHRLSVAAIMEAIEAREFEPFFQPQVDARTGEIVGAEALVRWRRPDGTIVPPGQFLQIATDTGLTPKIDVIVLDKICAFLSETPGVVPHLSINTIESNLKNDQYVEDILSLVKSGTTGISIELLETDFIDTPDAVFLWQLDMLRNGGVSIEIDDFGTGRTSILGLMAVSPDRLKIARELMLPLGERPDHVKLVTSVIDIATSLDMDVIAEGIETKEIAQLMVNIGCPVQQGFLHGKPMPFSSLVDLCRQDRVDLLPDQGHRLLR